MAGRLTIAAAGSGKTEMVVLDALKARRAAITTYTNRNTDEIRSRVRHFASAIPPHVDVMNWCTFLFRHGVAPYQHVLDLPYRIKQVSHEQAPGYTPADRHDDAGRSGGTTSIRPAGSTTTSSATSPVRSRNALAAWSPVA